MLHLTDEFLMLQTLDLIVALVLVFAVFSFLFGLYCWLHDVFERPYAHRSIECYPLGLFVIVGAYFYWRLHG